MVNIYPRFKRDCIPGRNLTHWDLFSLTCQSVVICPIARSELSTFWPLSQSAPQEKHLLPQIIRWGGRHNRTKHTRCDEIARQSSTAALRKSSTRAAQRFLRGLQDVGNVNAASFFWRAAHMSTEAHVYSALRWWKRQEQQLMIIASTTTKKAGYDESCVGWRRHDGWTAENCSSDSNTD